jgi:hypothetical protein
MQGILIDLTNIYLQSWSFLLPILITKYSKQEDQILKYILIMKIQLIAKETYNIEWTFEKEMFLLKVSIGLQR